MSDPAMNGETMNRREMLKMLGRSLLRSRGGQALLALAALGLGVGVALAVWHGRDVIAAFLFVVLVLLAFQVAWELLPFSAATRARWARARELAERYPSYRFQAAFWIGLGHAVSLLCRVASGSGFEPWSLAPAGFFIGVGLIAYTVWHWKHRDGAR
jgi:hypothetical protein